MKLNSKIFFALIFALAVIFIIAENAFSEKTIYITVDAEGSQEEIEAVVSVLEKNKISATFFILGETAEAYPALIKEISQSHSVQCHSYSHLNHRKLSYEEQRHLMEKGREAVYQATGKNCEFFRPPFLKKNSDTKTLIDELEFKKFKDLTPVSSVFFSDYLSFKIKLPANINWKFISALISQKKTSIIIVHPQITASSEKSLKYFDVFINRLRSKNAVFKTIS